MKLKNLIVPIIFTATFALTMYTCYTMGKEDAYTEIQEKKITDHYRLMNYYISEGYDKQIAKHLADVELGIIPVDSLYTIIKED